MNNLFLYIVVYYMFIDIQKFVFINEQQMSLVFLKSKTIFYARLLMMNLRNNTLLFFVLFFFLAFGIVLQLVHPIIMLLAMMMYVSSICLQYHNNYNYVKYVMYGIPGICFFFNRMDIAMLSSCLIIVLHLWLLLRFELKLYQKNVFSLPLTNLQNRKYVALVPFVGVGLVLLILLLYNHDKKIPVEEGLLGAAIYMLAVLEGQVVGNKVLVLRIKSRFDLIRSKSRRINFNFLLPMHRIVTLFILITLFMVTTTLGIVASNYLLYFILFAGGVLLFLHTIDYLTQCLLLQRSIVYENKIVRPIMSLLVDTAVFTYAGLFMTDKYIFSMNIASEQLQTDFDNVLWQSQLVSFVLYGAMLSFFVWRLVQAFNVNKRIKINNKT